MKVLLCEDVENLGWLGDVIEVKDGYARNYLVPQGIATVPTEANIKALAEEKTKRVQERKLVHEQAERAAQAVSGAEAVIAAKANEQGHLFGSVSERDIAANLRDQGFEIADKMVQLRDHIKEIGVHEVALKIAADLTVTVNVIVVSESADAEKDAEDSSQDETIESTDKDTDE